MVLGGVSERKQRCLLSNPRPRVILEIPQVLAAGTAMS